MAGLSKRERVDAALGGADVDRVPVAAWRHFIPEEQTADGLVAASLDFFHTYDWDWLKVNPRATYYAEAWGSRYDTSHYDGVMPLRVASPIATPDDLAKLTPVSPTEGVFGEELDVLRRIGAGLGGAHYIQTVFSPLSVLAFLTTRLGDQTPDLGPQSRFERVRALLHEHPQQVHHALDVISQTLAGYAAAVLETGASGLFFALVRLARADALTPEEFAEFGRPYDLRVLDAVKDAPFNLLHVCGPRSYVDLANSYPVHAVNWAAVGQGNPTLAEARATIDRVLVGGVDEHGTMQHGTPAQVQAEAAAAIEAAGARRFLLSPGCAVNLDVPAANLRALRQAAGA